MLAEQEVLREQCKHPSGEVAEITLDEVERSVPARFARIVEQYPDRLAIIDPARQLTYREMDVASNRIAHAIERPRHRAEGGRSNEPVAMMLVDKGVWMLTALHGVIKSGKCHFVIPPETPTDRAAFILDDLGCRLLLTDAQNLETARPLATGGVELLLLEEALQEENGGPLLIEIGPDTPYCVRYTSGSTGRPKGVLSLHRDYLNNVRAMIHVAQSCAQDRVSAFHQPYGTAVAASLVGATYYELGIPEAGLLTASQRLAERQITVVAGITTVFRQLVRSVEPGVRFPHLRVAVLFGEPLGAADLRAARDRFSDRFVVANCFGTNETNHIAHFYVTSESVSRLESVPVGYPAPEVEVQLLDEQGKPLPGSQHGEVGEIAVRSRYLSHGYWNRPELTQARFLPDTDGSGRRTYLTGDLGRRDADGCLYHLGRKDQQVKIRGHRVEIPEVEAELLETPGVQAAAVAARPGPDGEMRLVAYIVPRVAGLTVSAIRRALNRRLPLAFVPAAYVFLEKLPQSAALKIDRLALPPPPKARPPLDDAYTAPRTQVEQELARIWADVLGVAPVGIHDNFLELGGNSLLASQIVTRAIRSLRVSLPITALLAAPTVAEMALAVVQMQTRLASPDEIESLLAGLEAPM